MKAMMTAMMTAAIKRCLFIFLPWPVSRASAFPPGSRGHPGGQGFGRRGTAPREGRGPVEALTLSSSWFQKARIAAGESRGAWALGWGSLKAVPHPGSFGFPRGLCSQGPGLPALPPAWEEGSPLHLLWWKGVWEHSRICRRACAQY